MGRFIRTVCIICIISVVYMGNTGCATIIKGKGRSYYQLQRPTKGTANRRIRMGFFLLDLLFPPALIVDFATKAIYYPKPGKQKKQDCISCPKY